MRLLSPVQAGSAALVRGLARLQGWPLAGPLLRTVHRARFVRGWDQNGYSGAYATFEAAKAAAPPGKPVGYDHPEMAAYYRDRLDVREAEDYAPMYWLARARPRRVFDLGGHVGVTYHAFARALDLPPEAVWTVCDVPAVVEAGREVAARRGATALRFTTRQDDADGADVLLASGSLQYLPEHALQALLGRLERRPAHVIVQRTPLHATRSFVTVQATGFAFCPYTVASRPAFVAGMESLGYALVDAWTVDRSLEVPLEEGTRVERYAGLYFRLPDAT
jgi:putative methyltransferase (TIGR04325 family)